MSSVRNVAQPLETDVAIETPEHIVFRYRVAGPARRVLALAVDLLICWTAIFVTIIVVVLAIAGSAAVSDAIDTTRGAAIGLLLVVGFLAEWVYFAAWETWKGATPGKMAVGARVVTTAGRPIGFREAALRNLLRGFDHLPAFPLPIFPLVAIPLYVPALVSVAITRRFQRLGDLVAGTMVIVPEQARAASAFRLWPPPQPHELAAVPDDVTLDADERNAIELFLRRRGTLGAAREHELALMVIEPLARRFGFRLQDPVRMLALLYDRAANAGRLEAPPSSRTATMPSRDGRSREAG